MPLYDSYSDEQLAAEARDENLDAWEALIRRHGQRLLAFYTRMTGDESLSRELWVQAWGELWRQRGTLSGGGRVATAAFALATRTCLRAAVPTMHRIPAGDPSSLQVRSARLRQALLGVPARARAALCLCYFDNVSYEEAGRCLGANAGETRLLCGEAYGALARSLGPGFLNEGLA
jgi:DNA-directed RNA polymerase specialized sigma24 family protein